MDTVTAIATCPHCKEKWEYFVQDFKFKPDLACLNCILRRNILAMLNW